MPDPRDHGVPAALLAVITAPGVSVEKSSNFTGGVWAFVPKPDQVIEMVPFCTKGPVAEEIVTVSAIN